MILVHLEVKISGMKERDTYEINKFMGDGAGECGRGILLKKQIWERKRENKREEHFTK
jgi:hypothetical protein